LELLTPSCCELSFGSPPLLLGSGKLGTPFERMQRAKASIWELGDWALAGPPTFGEPPGPVDDGPPPHAASRARATAVIIALAASVGFRPGRRARWVVAFVGGGGGTGGGAAGHLPSADGGQHRGSLIPAFLRRQT